MAATAWAGVAGTAGAEEDAAGLGALGYRIVSIWRVQERLGKRTDLVDHAHDETLLLNLVGLNGVVVLQDLALNPVSPELPVLVRNVTYQSR